MGTEIKEHMPLIFFSNPKLMLKKEDENIYLAAVQKRAGGRKSFKMKKKKGKNAFNLAPTKGTQKISKIK
jgi:hypothetical protein